MSGSSLKAVAMPSNGGARTVAPKTSKSLLSQAVSQADLRLAGPQAWNTRSHDLDQTLIQAEGVVHKLLSGPIADLDQVELDRANGSMIDAIQSHGVGVWIETVRRHHDATYQHCMLVNGVTAAFVSSLGFNRGDALRVTLAATLHDIGKASIPLDILDCPTRLTPEQFAVIKTHPGEAVRMLADQPEIPAAVLDAVEHHHEYLDGSGYPHAIQGAKVKDLTRILTICDIFAALVEHRSYKPTMPPADAYEILVGMTGKLDPALVRAFRPVAAAASVG